MSTEFRLILKDEGTGFSMQVTDGNGNAAIDIDSLSNDEKFLLSAISAAAKGVSDFMALVQDTSAMLDSGTEEERAEVLKALTAMGYAVVDPKTGAQLNDSPEEGGSYGVDTSDLPDILK